MSEVKTTRGLRKQRKWIANVRFTIIEEEEIWNMQKEIRKLY